jgi:hypothetical protein
MLKDMDEALSSLKVPPTFETSWSYHLEHQKLKERLLRHVKALDEKPVASTSKAGEKDDLWNAA